MKPDGLLHFEPDYIAEGLGIPETAVRLLFQDGRNIASVLEHRFAELLHCTRPVDSCADHDLSGPGGHYEVRGITSNGCALIPPSMYGKGRKVDMAVFLARLNSLTGYVFADAALFPEVPYWCVPIAVIQGWVNTNQFGVWQRARRDKILLLLRNAFYKTLDVSPALWENELRERIH